MIVESLDRGSTIDGQNPWPGLCAFDEHSEQFFAGRDAERAELLRLVSQAPLTVLFGKSGLGKTSLILAGLFPRLRQQNVLPIYVRLDVRDRSAPLIRQAALALEAEITKHRIDATTPVVGESLWQHLHRHDAQWWSSKNQPLTPLFVFDQLEEAFTLGVTNSEGVERLRLDLADVIENRIPLELARRVETGDFVEGLDLRGQRYKVLLSLREDYLPDLEEWKIELPSLMRNRLRLLPLGADAALRVVSGTTSRGRIHDLVSDEAAREIVRFVAAAQSARGRRPGRNGPSDASDALPEKLEIEPALLSMVCEGLNERRKALAHPTIDARLLKQTGASIIGDFYRNCVRDVPQNTQRFVEDVLITESGYRSSYPVQDAIDQGWLTDQLLHRLIDQRLLRVSHQLGADRVELIHDLLTDVVRQERDRQRERARQRRQARRRWLEGGAALTLIAICAVFFGLWRSAQEAETQARAALRAAVSGKVTMDSRAILESKRMAPGDIALLLAAAGYRLQPDADTLGGLQFALNAAPNLVKVIGFSNPVFAISPDGRSAVTVDGNVLHLWNAATGQALAPPLESHTARVASVAYSADGRILVSGSSDSTVRVWDAATGKAKGNPLAGHTAVVASVAISNDGKLVVSGSADRTARLWDLATGEVRGDPLQGHSDSITKVAFSPDGKIVASGSLDKTVRLWDVATGRAFAPPLKGHTALISAIAFSPDGKTLASGAGDRMVRLWDVATGQPRGPPLQGHQELVSKLAFSPDGDILASGSADKTIRLWDLHTGQPVGEPLRGHTGGVSSIVYHGRTLVSGGLDGSFRIWDNFSTVAAHGPSVSSGGWILCVAISPDGNTVASGSVDNQIRLWDAKTRKPRGAALEGHAASVSGIAFSSDGGMLASSSLDGTVRLWDLASSTPRSRILTGHSDAVSSVAFSPDGRILASGGKDRTVRLWLAATGEPLGNPLLGHAGRVMSVAFSPDGKTVASAGEDGTIRIWNIETGALQRVLQGHAGPVSSVAFSRDGSIMVSGSHDRTLRLWDVATGRALGAPLQGHAQVVMSVAMSPDGKHIASGGGDNTLRFWDAVAGQPLGSPLDNHTAPVSSVTFSADGRTVISGSLDKKTPRFWDAPSAWAERVCARLVRNLSHAEWTRYVGDVDYVIQCPGLPVPSE